MRIKKFTKYTKLEVLWEDIISDCEWQDEEDVNKLKAIPAKTLGFYIKTIKRNLILGHSVLETGECDTTVIPWSVIKGINELGGKDVG